MLGRLIIGEKDVYKEYGVYVVEGGYNELISYPPLKPFKSNDWQEEDSLDIDLSAPTFNTRDFNIRFAIQGGSRKYYDFIDFLRNGGLGQGAYNLYEFKDIKRQFVLRLVSFGSYDELKELGSITIKFADDYPLLDQKKEFIPTGGGLPDIEDYEIDGKFLSNYGVRVLNGSLSSINSGGVVKPALIRNIATKEGATYDVGTPITLKQKDIKLNCLLRSDTLEEAWGNYYQLLKDITQPEAHSLFVSTLGLDYDFYYKGGSVNDFCPVGRVWIEFTLILSLLGNYTHDKDETILITESGDILVTETDEKAFAVKKKLK